ncbi:hypothetical protein Tco_0211609 [Tanacetum coccineum]
MIKESVDAAIAAKRARHANAGNDARGFGPVRGQDAALVVRECTFSGFMKCNLTVFRGTKGAVELQRWFEKTESIFGISECAEGKKVKFTAATLQGPALTWWNSKKVVRIPYGNKTLTVESDKGMSRLKVISCIKARKYIERGCHLCLAHMTVKKPKEKRLENIPVIRDFPEVFLDYLSGLPPPRQVTKDEGNDDEEDDIEVDIEEDENEPELTYPYEEVDPFNPPPPAYESEPEDVIEVEDTVEPKDETVPASVHEVGESSTVPFLQEDSDRMLPGLIRREIYSLFGRMTSLSRRIVEEGTDAMENLVRKLGNAEEKAECKKLKKELEEARFSNTLLHLQNERVERDLYWTRVRAHEFYLEMVRRGFVFEERPNETNNMVTYCKR